MNDVQKTVIDRTIAIQRAVKDNVSTEELRKHFDTLDVDIQDLHKARYVQPDLVAEREKLELALERKERYTLFDREESAIFTLGSNGHVTCVTRIGVYYSNCLVKASDAMLLFDRTVPTRPRAP